MRFGCAFLLSLLCLFQNVQVGQSMNLFVGGDGEDSPLGSMVCYMIPCADESLGWRNVFAPVAADPAVGQPEGLQPFGIPQDQVSTVRNQMRDVFSIREASR